MNSERGFTLPEVLIAALVLAIGLCSTAALFSYSAAANFRAGQHTAALSLLRDKIERLKALPLHAAEWTNGVYVEGVLLDPQRGLAIVNPASAPYRRAWTIDGSAPKRLAVTVLAKQPGRAGMAGGDGRGGGDESDGKDARDGYSELASAMLLAGSGF